MFGWLRNIGMTVWTVAQGFWVSLRYLLVTFQSDRGTFTEKFAYPENRFLLRPAIAVSQVRLDDLHRLRSVRQGVSRGLYIYWQGAGDGRKGSE